MWWIDIIDTKEKKKQKIQVDLTNLKNILALIIAYNKNDNK